MILMYGFMMGYGRSWGCCIWVPKGYGVLGRWDLWKEDVLGLGFVQSTQLRSITSSTGFWLMLFSIMHAFDILSPGPGELRASRRCHSIYTNLCLLTFYQLAIPRWVFHVLYLAARINEQPRSLPGIQSHTPSSPGGSLFRVCARTRMCAMSQ